MRQFETAVFMGSRRKDSFNRRLAAGILRLAPPYFAFKQAWLDDLPPHNQDDDADQPPPARRLKEEIRASSGVLFAAPEYNRSVPG